MTIFTAKKQAELLIKTETVTKFLAEAFQTAYQEFITEEDVEFHGFNAQDLLSALKAEWYEEELVEEALKEAETNWPAWSDYNRRDVSSLPDFVALELLVTVMRGRKHGGDWFKAEYYS